VWLREKPGELVEKHLRATFCAVIRVGFIYLLREGRHSCQACDDHAQRYPAGSSHPRRTHL